MQEECLKLLLDYYYGESRDDNHKNEIIELIQKQWDLILLIMGTSDEQFEFINLIQKLKHQEISSEVDNVDITDLDDILY
jgi:hypothetical protein